MEYTLVSNSIKSKLKYAKKLAMIYIIIILFFHRLPKMSFKKAVEKGRCQNTSYVCKNRFRSWMCLTGIKIHRFQVRDSCSKDTAMLDTMCSRNNVGIRIRFLRKRRRCPVLVPIYRICPEVRHVSFAWIRNVLKGNKSNVDNVTMTTRFEYQCPKRNLWIGVIVLHSSSNYKLHIIVI